MIQKVLVRRNIRYTFCQITTFYESLVIWGKSISNLIIFYLFFTAKEAINFCINSSDGICFCMYMLSFCIIFIGVCVCYYTIPNNEEMSRSYRNYNQRRRKSSVTDTTCIIIQQDINQTLTFDETWYLFVYRYYNFTEFFG